LIFQGIVFGDTPSAIDIYNQMYPIQPGTNVKVAYEMLGNPQEKSRIHNSLMWQLASNRFLVVFVNNSIIKDNGYFETYEQIEIARQRYEELKEGFYKILGSPIEVKELECASAWYVRNSLFTLVYETDNDIGPNIGVHFFSLK